MRRPRVQVVVPIAVAVALSLAAGLSLAEEHARLPAKQPAAPSDLFGETKPGVGSRALTGDNADDANAHRPTGLKQPVRLP